MRGRFSARLALSIGMAVAALAGTAAPAAQAAAAVPATEHAAPASPRPSGVIDPCPPTSPGTAGCATLTARTARGSAVNGPGRRAAAADATPSGYGPAALRAAYAFQSATAGSGQTVAVVTPYDDTDAASDLATYRSQYGIPPCSVADGCFRKVAQDGTSSLPPTFVGWSAAVAESMDMISAICPNCHILVVEANEASVPDLGTAEDEAVTLGAKFVVNDWTIAETSAETGWDTYFNHPGVAIAAPAGDSGYGNIVFPAASRYVTAVGGTTLTADSSSPRGYDETAWSGSGSGCSAYEPKPSWQTDDGCNGRTLNDVAADADGSTPVAFYDTQTEGGWNWGSGTTVAAAIIAAAYALAGTPASGTYPSSYPYQHPGGSYTTPGNAYPYSDGLNNITSGSNGTTCPVSYQCTAGAGYDGPTGLGTPAGTTALTSAGGQAGVIYSGLADKCLDDKGGAADPGTHVQLYDCNGGTTQDWTAEPDGTVRFTAATCMADSGTATTTGYHLVDLQPCDTSSGAMQWTPRADGSLYNPVTGWCLADPGASTANGTQLIIGTCNGSPSQQWTLPYTRPAASGAIPSKITTASLCLSDTDTSTANGNKIQIWQCNGDAAQTGWSAQPDGTLRILGKCLVTQNAGTADGTLIVLWTCEGEASQFWTQRSDGTLVNKTSGTCLADPSSSTVNGTQLVLHGCNTSTAEGWTLP